MKSVKKFTVSLVTMLSLLLTFGVIALAAEDLTYDNFNRTALNDLAAVGAEWTGGDAGNSVSIENNALKLEFGSSGWFGTGGGIDATPYKYLKIRVKGVAGGEGSQFDLNYAVGPEVKVTEKAFSDLISASGDPAITTEYQDIYIDLGANSIDTGIQAFHFNFHENVSGTIWIDEISFTNSAPAASTADTASQETETEETTSEEASPAENNPDTGDGTNVILYLIISIMSGIAIVVFATRSRKLAN